MHTLGSRLPELVRKLDALGLRPSLIDLAHAMEATHLTRADVALFVQTNPQSYNRASVVVREHYELLVMTWLPGQASVPHDHNGSTCVMQVMQGEAIEGCYRVAADGFVDLEYEEVVRTGGVSAGQDAGVHTVRNASRADETLVTLHVYTPPLRDFRWFVPRPTLGSGHRRTIPDAVPKIVIVGGGFSGSMTAAQILRRTGAPLQISLIERRGAVGEGLAYATREPAHLLNVPAGRMSAWPDRPDDFLEWALQRYGNVGPTDFLPRQWYGEYIRETLLASAADTGDPERLSIIFDEVRRVAGTDWRSVVDALRPHTARLWQAMPSAERRRFLSRLRAFWEVHRHRMGLPVAHQFQAMLERKDVRMIAGRVVSVHEEGNKVRVVVRLRGTSRQIELSAGWVINCTGPMPSNSPDSNPVIDSLLLHGQLCLDELALGVETTTAGNAIAAGGAEVPTVETKRRHFRDRPNHAAFAESPVGNGGKSRARPCGQALFEIGSRTIYRPQGERLVRRRIEGTS